MFLAVCSAVAVPAFPLASPVTLPVMLPTNPPEAVTTPETAAVTIEISSFRLTVTPLLAAFEERLEPPEIVKDSDRRSISSDPLSPTTVNPLPTAVVVADVIRPFESTVSTGTAAAPPYDPAETPLSASVIGRATFPVPSND